MNVRNQVGAQRPKMTDRTLARHRYQWHGSVPVKKSIIKHPFIAKVAAGTFRTTYLIKLVLTSHSRHRACVANTC